MKSKRRASEARRAVFLDRDGTLIDELGYLADPEGVRLLPGAAEALAQLAEAGFPCVLITNQSGVARGLFDEPTLAAVHDSLGRWLAERGARLEAIYYCPHHPSLGSDEYRQACSCRKPEPGMYFQAASEMKLDLAHSVAVGDSERDLEAARRAGVPTRILVLTGQGQATRDAWRAAPGAHPATHIFADLSAALATIQAELQAD